MGFIKSLGSIRFLVGFMPVCASFKNLLSNSQTPRQRFRNRWKVGGKHSTLQLRSFGFQEIHFISFVFVTKIENIDFSKYLHKWLPSPDPTPLCSRFIYVICICTCTGVQHEFHIYQMIFLSFKSNTAGVTSVAGTTNPSGVHSCFIGVHVMLLNL